MRPEDVAGALTGKSKPLDDVGRSTRAHDERAAYLARVSAQAMHYADVVYFGDTSDKAIRRVYRNVLLAVSRDWQPIGTRPEGKEAWHKWREKQAHLIERLTCMALAEMMNTAIGLPNRAEWRAQRVGVNKRRWYQAYRERYDRITAVLNDWDSEFRGKVTVNQREKRA
jgi:hypothetical protein